MPIVSWHAELPTAVAVVMSGSVSRFEEDPLLIVSGGWPNESEGQAPQNAKSASSLAYMYSGDEVAEKCQLPERASATVRPRNLRAMMAASACSLWMAAKGEMTSQPTVSYKVPKVVTMPSSWPTSSRLGLAKVSPRHAHCVMEFDEKGKADRR
ncbi:hypothetical protein [Amycolatopsis antarctica]|uniref:hypothetical protein n=1 Tax=Amycolatopsis antarctica TaxID=1854586 RepID=UPI0010548499|nr:hypothetical protein [Amycolatopsis antarctica]